MNLSSALRRLGSMSPPEIRTRTSQEFAKRYDVFLSRLGRDPYAGGFKGVEARGRFFCDPGDTPRILDVLRRRMPHWEQATLARAERILQGRFDLLGYRDLDFGSPLDWSLDPVHRKRAPSLPWPSIPFLNFAAIGDHKVIWELSRLQFLLDLGKAWHLTGDRRFTDALKRICADWRSKNPYPIGVNWASTLEVAFRSLSLMWAAFLLEGTDADSPEFQRDTAREIARGGWYISRFLSTYFSPNTHLLGEGVALFLIAVRYPGLPQAAVWRDTGWQIVLQEARRQVRTDGLHFEQSIYYHVYALDFFLHARLLAERNGVAVPPQLDKTIRAMASALVELSQAGALPRFGDDDGGRLFDGSRNRPEHMFDPLSTVAVLFGDRNCKAAAAGLCEETLWLLGPSSAAAFDALPPAPRCPHSAALEAAGIYAMASPASAGGPSQLFIDAGELGSLAAGHGHADALSIQLAANGRLWLTDPGTGAYMGDGSVRERFRGTAAHNTLTVDGRHQADPMGPFSWGPLPRIETQRWVGTRTFDLWEGRHCGYEQLACPVVHRRFVLRWGPGFWMVRDVVEGRGTHRLDLNWHFAPETSVQPCGPEFVARIGGESLSLLPATVPGWECAIEAGDYSPAYGATLPAPVVRCSATVSCPAEIAAILRLGPATGTASLQPAAPFEDGVSVYTYSGEAEERRFFFALRAGEPWKAGDWTSDAVVVCSAAGELFVAGGSYLEYRGNRVLSFSSGLAAIECGIRSGRWTVVEPDSGGIQFRPEALP